MLYEVFVKAVEFVPEDFQAIVGSKHFRSKRKNSNSQVSLASTEEDDNKSRRKWKAGSLLRYGEDKNNSSMKPPAAEKASVEDTDEAMNDIATDWTIDQAKEAQTTVQKWVENVGDKKYRPDIQKWRQLFESTPTSVLKHMDLPDIRSELASTDRVSQKRSMYLLTTYMSGLIDIVQCLSVLGSEEATPAVNELPLKSEPSDL